MTEPGGERFHHFTVRATGPTGRAAEIWMDGRRLRGVREYKLKVGVAEPNEMTVTFVAGSINREGID